MSAWTMKFWIWLAWKLPKPLVYFAAERLIAHAGATHAAPNMNALTPAQCLRAWPWKY